MASQRQSSTLRKKQTLPERLAEIISEKISRNEYPMGSKLPSARKLADEYQLSVNTVRAAMQHLMREGIVIVKANSGAYVLKKAASTHSRQECFLNGKPSSRVLYFLFHLDMLRCSNSFYQQIISTMQQEAGFANWQLKIADASDIHEIAADTGNAAAFIYMPDQKHPYDLDWSGITLPRVIFSIGEKSLNSSYVTPDNYQGGYLAAEYILSRRQDIMIFSFSQSNIRYIGEKPYRERIQGISDYMRLQKKEIPQITNLSEGKLLRQQLYYLLRMPKEQRRGLIFLGDHYLTGDLEEAVNAWYPGMKLHEEFDLVSFQDYSQKQDLPYATVNFSHTVLCREVISLVERLIRHPGDAPIRIKTPMFLWPGKK